MEEPKEYWHLFLPITPLKAADESDKSRRLTETTINIDDRYTLWMSYIGRDKRIDAIVISYRYCDKHAVEPHVRQAFDHAFAVLVLALGEQIGVVHAMDDLMMIGSFSDERWPSEFPFGITINPSSEIIEPKARQAAAMFSTTIGYRAAVGALSEAHTLSIPKHYRFLSLVRALELLFPLERERKSWLDRYQLPFEVAANTTREFKGYVLELRKRCAHGVGRGTSDPIVSLGMAGGSEVQAAFNTLMQAVSDRIVEVGGIQRAGPARRLPLPYSPQGIETIPPRPFPGRRRRP